MSDSGGEKSHDPTPQRREQFKKEGRFAKSRDIGGVLGMAAVMGALLGSRGAIGRSIDGLFAGTHGDLTALSRGDSGSVIRIALTALAVLAVPSALAGAGFGVLGGLVQSGARINTDAFTFKPERLNPFPNLLQLFSPKKGAMNVIMSLARVGVVGYVAYRALSLELPDLLVLARLPLESGVTRLTQALVRVVTSSLGALGGIAALDYAQSRFTLSQDMKMTRQEVMDENKSQDGDPKVRARMRARAKALARKRSLANVKQASVIIANPTHISVALRYTRKDPAPIVVAKGHDDVAMLIRAEARKHGIPILENRPLARALDADVPIGHVVPAAHFAAVARVLAFVYRLRGGRGMGRA